MRQNLAFFVCIALVLVHSTQARGVPLNAEKGLLLPPRVLVVGGGVAGLTAASTLHATGKYNVTLLEAMPRIGGRTHTMRFTSTEPGVPGYHVEMGGEWVHGEDGNPVFELVHPMGLVDRLADPPQAQYQFPFQHGGRVDDSTGAALEELYELVYEDPDSWADHMRGASLGEYARIFLEEYIRHEELEWEGEFFEVVLDWLHRRLLEEEAADNWFEASASDEGDQYAILPGYENVTWRPPYGYSSLHQLLLTGNVTTDGEYELPAYIQLNTEVISVDYTNPAFVRVWTRESDYFDVDHVIFTPSLGVLKATHQAIFSPPLPIKKALTIQHFGFGTATKYYLEFSAAWWPANYSGAFLLWDDITYDYADPRWQYWRANITLEELMIDFGGLPLWARAIARIFTVDSRSHPNMLRAWVTGATSKFMDNMDVDYVRDIMMVLVRRFLGPQMPEGTVIPEPVAVYQSRWWSNPFTRGTYSFRTLDSDRYDVWAKDLGEPILTPAGKPALCFGGEATHPIFFSAVHGAYASGLREAERIEAWYSGVTP